MNDFSSTNLLFGSTRGDVNSVGVIFCRISFVIVCRTLRLSLRSTQMPYYDEIFNRNRVWAIIQFTDNVVRHALLTFYTVFQTRCSADADKLRDAFRGRSRLTNMVPFSVRCDFSLSMWPAPRIHNTALCGRGRGHVTQLPKFWDPLNNVWTNWAIRFKFGIQIKDGPFLRTDHKLSFAGGSWLVFAWQLQNSKHVNNNKTANIKDKDLKVYNDMYKVDCISHNTLT